MAADGKYRFRVDLHVHTRRYSPCAESLDPRQLGKTMTAYRLDGVVITEHDQLWPVEDIAALNHPLRKKRIYRGVEISSSNGHFIVIGLNNLNGIEPGIAIDKLIAHIEPQGAAIIWAHPYLNYCSTPSPLTGYTLPDGLHAVEVASGVTTGKATTAGRAMARLMGWSAVGGSDAHTPRQVGCAYTLLNELPENEEILAAVIRNGYCKARHRRNKPGR